MNNLLEVVFKPLCDVLIIALSIIHISHNKQWGVGLELVYEVEVTQSSHNSKWLQVAQVVKQLLRDNRPTSAI